MEFRVGVARRLVNGESATALHSELRIKRSMLYRWPDAYARAGEAGLKTLKAEEVYLQQHRDADHARALIGNFIDAI